MTLPTMDKSTAEALWSAITGYADSMAGVAGEGNSGEFSDEEEAQALEAELAEAQTLLCSRFAETTGWLPVFKEGSQSTNWLDEWFLLPKDGADQQRRE